MIPKLLIVLVLLKVGLQFHSVNGALQTNSIIDNVEIYKKIFEKLDTLNTKCHKSKYPKNCKELRAQGTNVSGIYTIQPEFSPKPFLVFCDMGTKGGGWAMFLNRKDGSQNFSLPWEKYKKGFGNLAGEFWLGLDHLHALTGMEVNELLIELIDWNLQKYHIRYNSFSVAGEDEDYYLKVLGGYSGDLPDSFTYHSGQKFITIDRRNDDDPDAKFFGGGGWWHHDRRLSLLTGRYLGEWESIKGNNHRGIFWSGYKAKKLVPHYSLKEARMMIRPRVDTS